MIRMNRCIILCLSFLFQISSNFSQNGVFVVTALVSTVPQQSKNKIQDIASTNNVVINNNQMIYQRTQNDLSSIRIRSTKETDLPTIIDLLAFEASTSQNTKNETPQQKTSNLPLLFGNWNMSMKKLKSEVSFSSQLTQRFAAKKRAEKVLSIHHNQQQQKLTNDIEELRYILWADDTFRNKLEKAVQTTSTWEGTIWDDWNFALTPESNMLHHCMITALDDEFVGINADDDDDESASVVGFCEIGICNVPSNYDCKEGQSRYMPCIGNLVVSPNHRRRGIGKRLIQSAIRLMRLTSHRYDTHSFDNGNSLIDTVSLYVDEDNFQAIRLYEREGFVVAGRCHEKDNERVFMTLKI
jgi:ribosomal protein S18 acetylase RimI-like enzyme